MPVIFGFNYALVHVYFRFKKYINSFLIFYFYNYIHSLIRHVLTSRGRTERGYAYLPAPARHCPPGVLSRNYIPCPDRGLFLRQKGGKTLQSSGARWVILFLINKHHHELSWTCVSASSRMKRIFSVLLRRLCMLRCTFSCVLNMIIKYYCWETCSSCRFKNWHRNHLQPSVII